MVKYRWYIDGLIHRIPYLGILQMIKSPVFDPPLSRLQGAGLKCAIGISGMHGYNFFLKINENWQTNLRVEVDPSELM